MVPSRVPCALYCRTRSLDPRRASRRLGAGGNLLQAAKSYLGSQQHGRILSMCIGGLEGLVGKQRTDVMKTFLRRIHSARHFAQSTSIFASSSTEMSGAPERSGTSLSVSCAVFVGTRI